MNIQPIEIVSVCVWVRVEYSERDQQFISLKYKYQKSINVASFYRLSLFFAIQLWYLFTLPKNKLSLIHTTYKSYWACNFLCRFLHISPATQWHNNQFSIISTVTTVFILHCLLSQSISKITLYKSMRVYCGSLLLFFHFHSFDTKETFPGVGAGDGFSLVVVCWMDSKIKRKKKLSRIEHESEKQ